jgi:hypothetical protein
MPSWLMLYQMVVRRLRRLLGWLRCEGSGSEILGAARLELVSASPAIRMDFTACRYILSFRIKRLSSVGRPRGNDLPQARTTWMRRPWGLSCSALAVRSAIGGWPARRSKITSQPLSRPNPAR